MASNKDGLNTSDRVEIDDYLTIIAKQRQAAKSAATKKATKKAPVKKAK